MFTKGPPTFAIGVKCPLWAMTAPGVDPPEPQSCRPQQPGRIEDGRGSLGPMANAPFPISAHRTGRADFRHPALRLVSPQGTRRANGGAAVKTQQTQFSIEQCYKRRGAVDAVREVHRQICRVLHRRGGRRPVQVLRYDPAWRAYQMAKRGVTDAAFHRSGSSNAANRLHQGCSEAI